MRSKPPAPAVFVDPTGRRRRFARRAAVVFAVPATGYVCLLVSTMVGGPSLDTPFIPLPDAVRPESRQHQVDERTVPDGPSGTIGPGAATTTPSGTPGESPSPTVPTPTQPPTTIQGSPQPTVTPTPLPSTPGRPTTLPTQAPSTPGAKPGRTNSPTQRPTHTPRGPSSN